MRIWLNFMYDHVGWDIHCLAADGKTVISPHIRVAQDKTVVDILKAVGADEKTLLSIGQKMLTGCGTVAIDLNEKGRELLRIRAETPD
jgi:hypothetical protein